MGAPAASPDLLRARELVLEHGWNSTAYQILNPGIDLWFSPSRPAVIGYTRRCGVLLVAGAPVCQWLDLDPVCKEFEGFAERLGQRVCYVCAEERLRALFESSAHHATVALGAQPAWDPRRWRDLTLHRASLRAQLNRARNHGVAIDSLPVHRAAADRDLRRILDEWLRARLLPPLHFLVEPNLLDGVLADRVILVARRGNLPVAFLVASPVRARGGYLIELLARSADAPNGVIELLIDHAMRRFAAEDCTWTTLGLVALAHAADTEIGANPAWLQGLMFFARAHANRFYSFRGLEHFRSKMSPDRWETIYAISNESRFSPRTLYAIGSAFSGIPPWAAIAIAVVKAARQELRTAFRSQPGTRSSASPNEHTLAVPSRSTTPAGS